MKNFCYAIIALFFAELLWGFMSPFAKDAMNAGFSVPGMVLIRMLGALTLFWLWSFTRPREKVPIKDVSLLMLGGVFGILLNQGTFFIGLSMTSPIDATVICTIVPIITLILGLVFLKEKLNLSRTLGIILGLIGACYTVPITVDTEDLSHPQ